MAGAGFDPAYVLPVVIDVGTANKALREDAYYLGLDQDRVSGDDYFAILDEVGPK